MARPLSSPVRTDRDKSVASLTSLSASLKSNAFDGRLRSSLRATYLDTKIANFAYGAADGQTSAEKTGLYFDNRISLTEGHSLTLAVDYEKTD